MSEPISVQWPNADLLRFGKRSDGSNKNINISRSEGAVALNVTNNTNNIIMQSNDSGASTIHMYYGNGGIQLDTSASHTSKMSMFGNSTNAIIELNANSNSTASIDLRSGSNNCIRLNTATDETSSTGEFVIYGASTECVRIQSSSNQTGRISLLQGGNTQLEMYTDTAKTSTIKMYYGGNECIIAETREDSTGIITLKNAGDDCIYIESLADRQSRIIMKNNGSERIYIGTELDDDNEYNYVKVEHNRSGNYTALDERGLLLPTKFDNPSSTEPDNENETRIEAFDSDFLSYANNNQEKIDYLKRTVPSSYAVSSAIKAIQPFNVYPFEFIVTDSDSDGNAEFKIRYYYQDGSNRYRDFTFNYADKQGSASAEFDAAPVTLTGIDKYVARVNSLIAGGSGSAIIADETFDSQRMLAWNYSSSVPVDIEFINCTFTNDSMVSLFAAVAGQSSPASLTVKFTNCNCNAIIDMHSMFANLIDTTRLSIDGLKVTTVSNIERLFVYLGARTDGCDLVIDNSDFGTVKRYISDIYSWSKVKEINLKAIGLTDQTINIRPSGTVSTNIGDLRPNCDEVAIIPYYKPLSSFTVYGKIPRDNVAKPARTDGFLNYSYNFIASDYEVGGNNELNFKGVGMNDAPATVRNQYYTIRFYTVNELTLDNYMDSGPYVPEIDLISLSFNYPDNVSGITVSPKLERFGVYFTIEATAAAAGITRMILMNGSTAVATFDGITYAGPEEGDDTHAILYNGDDFIEYFNEQNYSFTLNNGDVYFRFTNPDDTIPSFEYNCILVIK